MQNRFSVLTHAYIMAQIINEVDMPLNSNIKILGTALLILTLASCDGNFGSNDNSGDKTDGVYTGDVNQKASKKGIRFTSNMTAGTKITVHGHYDPELFGEVVFDDGSKVLLMDDGTAPGSYYGAGFQTSSFTEGLLINHSKVLEVQSLDYLEFIQDVLTKRGFESEAIDHYKTSNSQSSVIKTVVNVSAEEAVSPSLIRNIILIAFNNGAVPSGLPINKNSATNKVKLEIAYWQDEGKGDVYLWLSTFANEDTDPVTIKYGDIINATALSSLRLSL